MNFKNNKYVQRPIVRMASYKPPSKEACIEYNYFKKENKNLFLEADFSAKVINMRRQMHKLNKIKNELNLIYKKFDCLKMIDPKVSFADKTKERNCVPSPSATSSVPSEPTSEFILSLDEARQDFKLAFKNYQKERKEAIQLVQGIANRYPKKIYPVQKSRVNLITLSEGVKCLNREKRFNKRHPAKEVKVFPLGCFSYTPSPPPLAVTVADITRKSNIFVNGKVQKKYKRDRNSFETLKSILNNCYKFKEEIRSMDEDMKIKIDFLSFKIRMLILRFRQPHYVEWLYNKKINNFDKPQSQMDDKGVVQSTKQVVDIKSNVAIIEENATEKGTSHIRSDQFSMYSVSRQAQLFKTFTDRWLFLKTVEWTNGYTVESPALLHVGLPYELFKAHQNASNLAILLNNRFFRFDMKIKAILNSSPFQIGCVVVDWIYGKNEALMNVYSALQRNHAKLSAGSSNNVELFIPYHHFNSMLSNETSDLSLGYLSIRVLNQLRASEAVSKECRISVYVSLENISAHGLIDRSVAIENVRKNMGPQGQMNTIGSLCSMGSKGLETVSEVSNVGSNLLRTAGEIFNQDKPPLPLQPMSLIPQTVPSFAYTDGIAEPINVLRSDPRGQRQPPLVTDEMSLSKLARGWGFLKTIQWTVSSKRSVPLYSCKVMPLFDDPKKYGSYGSTDVTDIYNAVLPPVAFVASLVSKVRGNIDYRVEIIANGYYTGCIVITIVPMGNGEPMESAMLSMNEVLDIQKTSVIDISAPWNWYNAWMNTPNLHRSGNYYAELQIFVLNELISIDSVPTSIDINIYIKGGDNFEVCQLKTPLWALNSKALIPPTNYILKPWNFETKWYTTNSSNVTNNGNHQWTTMYLGNVSNGWVGYINVQEFTLYELSNLIFPESQKIKFMCVKYLNEGKTKTSMIKWGVYHVGLSTGNAHGLLAFVNKQNAIDALLLFKQKGYGPEVGEEYFKNDDHLKEKFYTDGPWSTLQTGLNPPYEADNKDGQWPIWKQIDYDQKDFVFVSNEVDPEGQMDKQAYTITTEEEAPSTSMGLKIYGEKTPDLKGIARRWQHYTSFAGVTCQEKFPRDCRYLCRIPVRPWRKVNPKVSSNYDNRLREGAIGLINGIFEFWDGGIRYRIVATHTLPSGAILYIIHRFDDERPVSEDIESGNLPALHAGDLMDTHYPTFVQSLSVNPVCTIEVPYMRSQERLTTHQDSSLPSNNGYLYFWVHSPEKAVVNLEIYYAVADDFQWTIFQGIPRMFNLKDIPSEPVPQMDAEGNMFEAIKNSLTPTFVSNFSEASSSVRELTGDIKKTSDAVEQSAKTIITSADNISESFSSLTSRLENIADSLMGAPKILSEAQKHRKDRGYLGNMLDDLKESSFDYLSHIVYCAISPTKATIGWALVNIYRNIFGFTMQGLVQAQNFISSLWDRANQATQQPQPVPQMEDTDISSLCSILYCSFCTLLNLKVKPPNSWNNVSDGLFKFSMYARGGTFIGAFFKDNIELLRRVWNKLLSFFGLKQNNFKLIAGIKDDRLKHWVMACEALLNPNVRDTVLTNPVWAEKVFSLGIVGRSLSLTIAEEPAATVGLRNLVLQCLKGIKKLEQDLVNRNVFCGERYEPFCLWIAGPAGCGKTRYLHNVADQLAEFHHSTSVQTYHTITINQKYFDGFIGQPSVLIDDFLTVAPLRDENSNLYIQMKSSALFNPPYAEAEDKAKLVNFMNLLISSNFLEVGSDPGIHDKTAYNRRRDLVLSMEMRDTSKIAKEFSNEACSKLEHVKIYYHPDPLNTAIKTLIAREKGVDYVDTVNKFILVKAKEYHLKEAGSFNEKVKRKQQRIEKIAASTSNLTEYLDKVMETMEIKVPDVKETNQQSNTVYEYVKEHLFGIWKVAKQQEVKHDDKEDVVEPEGQNDRKEFYEAKNVWPSNSISTETFVYKPHLYEDIATKQDLVTTGPPGDTIYYFKRSCYSLPELSEGNRNKCAHVLAAPYLQHYFFNKESNMYILNALIDVPTNVLEELPTSFSADYCRIFKSPNEATNDILAVTHPNCIMLSEKSATDFRTLVMKETMDSNVVIFNKLLSCENFEQGFKKRDGDELSIIDQIDLPVHWAKEWFDKTKETMKTIKPALENARLRYQLDILQKRLKDKVVIIGDDVLPKDSPRKGWCRTIWDKFLQICRNVCIIFGYVNQVLCFIMIILGFAGGTFLLREQTKNNVMPNLHPSGDFKTMKIKPSIRAKALQLVQSQSPKENDQSLINLCKEQFSDDSSDGRLKKIVSNVFMMIGIKKIDETHTMNYKVRCIGLKEFDFICLKHYIDHFKDKGVEEIAIVYRKGKGVVRFKLNDIEFKWTDAGYGIGTLPVCGQPFKNIVKFLPSEKFDGNYPYEMFMVEVFTDDLRIYKLDCKKLNRTIHIPKSQGQESWSIKHGFEYDWEGAGRCGSFLFAPQLASPFIGIHTSGIPGRCGYSEILLRETFVEDDLIVDFIMPQMEISDNGFEPKGEAYIVGHLPPEKSVNIPNKTKIQPSLIHGVFPVKTEPAPLTGKDERLEEYFDPLLEGISKRCDKPHEMPSEFLQEAYIDLRNIILQSKPLKSVGILSIKEAIEGLELKGYEPLEIRTSEGYPWVLERPKTASDKSWMFNFEEENGRRKLNGIYKKLYDVLDVKDKMRSNLIVPLTYATACLKDARIKKEKVQKPGATRVFEMCPVDMTIAQRQYYLDFYASYCNSRLKCEHTIGINPDGPEWTELAESLNSFSPYILTADYSGYGPRLLKSVQLKSLLIETGWYEEWQRIEGCSEETIEEEFKRRYSFIWESLCHPVVVKNAVIQFNTGMDSGNPATVIRNSICNSLLIRCIYLYLAKKYAKHYCSLYWFHFFIKMVSNGDDLIMAVKQNIIGWFNNKTMIEAFADFNIKMTDALKSGSDIREYCSIEEATYLKRGFKRHPNRLGQWLAPLERDSITDTANWIWRGMNDKLASLVNSEQCARLAYTQGPEFYNYITKTLESKWKELGVVFRSPSWESLDEHVWEQIEGPLFVYV